MATVVNRTTLNVRQSVNTPDYSTSSWCINPPGLAALLSGGVPQRYWKIVGDDVQEQTPAEKLVTDAGLMNAYKRQRCVEIDARTLELAEAGVEYPASSGAFYSIAPVALYEFRLAIDRDTYPFEWESIDGLAAESITGAVMAEARLNAAANKLLTLKDSGAALKTQIRAATTKAALDAIVDTR